MTVMYYDEKEEKSVFLENVSRVNFYHEEEMPIACVHFADTGKSEIDIKLVDIYRIEE